MELETRKKVSDIKIGDRFGQSVVIKITRPKPIEKGKHYTLLCDCGTKYYECGTKLIKKDRRSCGCKRNSDLIGQTFGQGKVIQYDGIDKFHNKLWILECSCGKKYKVRTGSLKSGHTKSCGCTSHPLLETTNPNINSTYWHGLTYGAKSRNIKVKITPNEAWDIFLKQEGKCALTGVDLIMGAREKDEHTASLDRIDSSEDYIVGNVQWVHKWINIMKWSLTQEEFINICNLVMKNRGISNISTWINKSWPQRRKKNDI